MALERFREPAHRHVGVSDGLDLLDAETESQRVKLGEHWVDEAAGYHPGDTGHAARTNLLVFTEPCGYEVNDPRRNGYREDWHRYLSADRATPAWDASAGPRPVCSLNGATNLITNPWHIPYGQGLPLVHFNRLLDRAGDIGYIQQPYPNPGHPDTSSNSNLWQSICLASTNVLASNAAGFSFTAGSVLEVLTARAINTPVRGLVHFSTTHTNVVEAIAADLPIYGISNRVAYLDNYGPLVRENRMTNNDINGMLVRGGTRNLKVVLFGRQTPAGP